MMAGHCQIVACLDMKEWKSKGKEESEFVGVESNTFDALPIAYQSPIVVTINLPLFGMRINLGLPFK